MKPNGEEPKAACVVIGEDQTTRMTNGDCQQTEEILIGGRPVNALVDTGVIISVISPSLAGKLKMKTVPWEGPMVVTADKQPMNPKGKVSLTVTSKNASVEDEALVLKTFGRDLIMESGACNYKTIYDRYTAWPVPVPGNAVWAMLTSKHILTANGSGVGRIEMDRFPGLHG
ncbi:hypothetical protein OUZ56_026096 [Daphnia magna]|uniref:Peptidase A2 domain-containing protein n=1 Tax=Daphnia magna TaxID=35525 RepID=A0ABQ9ZKW2_9CRUS|nr:hypothetical protein OUZ56_026096 [Daphnia magna]